MAEATGLALGGITLASLVTTCVEFIQYYEDGKHYMRDFTLAVTKVNLMKTRLGQLGDIEKSSIRPCLPDGTAETTHLENNWHHVVNVLPDGASGIENIIQRATKLCKRYSRGGGEEANKSQVEAQPSSQQRHGNVSPDEMTQAGRPAILQTMRRKTSWALHDKKKFEGLIADFDFILSNLEKIIESADASTRKKLEPKRETAVMDARDKPDNKIVEKCNSSKKMDEKISRNNNSIPRKPQDAHTGNSPAPPACHARAGPTPPSEASFTGNVSKGQSLHFVGGPGGWSAASFLHNDSHDQSLALTGTYAEPVMSEAFQAWRHIAMQAVMQQQQQQQRPAQQDPATPTTATGKDKQLFSEERKEIKHSWPILAS